MGRDLDPFASFLSEWDLCPSGLDLGDKKSYFRKMGRWDLGFSVGRWYRTAGPWVSARGTKGF